MNRRLFWKLCFVIGMGVVALFYVIDLAISRVENDMSSIAYEDREELLRWSARAEQLLKDGDVDNLETWLQALQEEEQIWAAVATAEITQIAGNRSGMDRYTGYNMGRNIDWQIHLWFEHNPIMELPFADGRSSLLIELPLRMRPGSYWQEAQIALQVVLPLLILIALVVVLYSHIMAPLRELQRATQSFSLGDFDVRVRDLLGSRDDEIAQLANTFDQMAARLGDLFATQRQLITDLSHELRTPLTRLDIAVDNLTEELEAGETEKGKESLERVHRESRHIRKLVDDTLTFAWLKNEAPSLERESLDLVDLIEVLVDDARFEYPDRVITTNLPETADVKESNHRALGQALENILRNALRYTPKGKTVSVSLAQKDKHYDIEINDEGPGVPEQHLSAIFRPFFRVEKSRPTSGSSFGLGLALARRQLAAVAASVRAANLRGGGLQITVTVPQVSM
ncbi:MAG: histidine kinase sensor domain-containing protein [Pseudomonadota bacterium]